jgi:putative glutamine amidotransferase
MDHPTDDGKKRRMLLSCLIVLFFNALGLEYANCDTSSGVSRVEKRVEALYGWPTQQHQMTLILPKWEGVDERILVEQWKKSLLSADAYHSFLNSFQGKEDVFADYSDSPFVPLSVQPQKAALRMCFIANRPGHLTLSDQRAKNMYETFSHLGAEVYVIPIGLEMVLNSATQLNDFHGKIAQYCSVLVAMGGTDLDPSLYHQANTHSVNTHLQMDQTELQLIRKYSEASLGVFYGICRGHQAYSVAMGGELYQDISLLEKPDSSGVSKNLVAMHRERGLPGGRFQNVWHDIELSDDKNALMDAVGKKKFRVNSRHHQAVKTSPGSKVIAWAEGGVVEAVEKRDAQGNVRVLTVQFHPEDMYTSESRQVLQWMVANGLKVQAQSKMSAETPAASKKTQ